MLDAGLTRYVQMKLLLNPRLKPKRKNNPRKRIRATRREREASAIKRKHLLLSRLRSRKLRKRSKIRPKSQRRKSKRLTNNKRYITILV